MLVAEHGTVANMFVSMSFYCLFTESITEGANVDLNAAHYPRINLPQRKTAFQSSKIFRDNIVV